MGLTKSPLRSSINPNLRFKSASIKQVFLVSAIYLIIFALCSSYLLRKLFFIPGSRTTMADHEAAGFESPRQVVKKVLAKSQEEGVGATVRRSIGRWELKNLDPFLMLDEFSVSAPAGFPDHPHRGFETVTYMLEGAFTHQDFAGHKGTIMAGDLQWMTAGRGIVHSEMPAADGVNKGLQLWINLSSKDKM
ncbi:pirin-like protein [Canna indica]|uniref:Pirin-like protein n=1 Tax=Canna indica TaxID=4628 RepID=A0AAQ3Q3T3_9LILI|nr:pirin-like protein [Canna indica]